VDAGRERVPGALEFVVLAGGDRGLGPLSHYGARPTRDGFVAYQKDLRELVFAEIGSLDVRVLDGTADVADTVREVRAEFLRR
jgi:hypothetical protein